MNTPNNIFLGTTGSIASIKFFQLHDELKKNNFNITWSTTSAADGFILNTLIAELQNIPEIPKESLDVFITYISEQIRDSLKSRDFQISDPLNRFILPKLYELGDIEGVERLIDILNDYESGQDLKGVTSKEKGHVKHINIAEQVDAVLIAPTSANTLAKIVNGTTDNFILEVARALPRGKKVYLPLSMNTEMLEDPFTQNNIQKIQDIGSEKYKIINSIEKTLQCGTHGNGAMEEVEQIVQTIITNC